MGYPVDALDFYEYDLAGRKRKTIDSGNQSFFQVKADFGSRIFFYRITFNDHTY